MRFLWENSAGLDLVLLVVVFTVHHELEFLRVYGPEVLYASLVGEFHLPGLDCVLNRLL